MTKLTPDTSCPPLTVATIAPEGASQTWDIAAQSPELLTMVVVYRGYHCPICSDYLGKLNGLVHEFTGQGVNIIAVSMDIQERARLAKTEWGLDQLTIGYGMDAKTAQAWGLYLSQSIKEAEPTLFAEPGLFWVLPNGRLYLMEIANMPFARPDLELLLAKAVAVKNGYPARGTA